MRRRSHPPVDCPIRGGPSGPGPGGRTLALAAATAVTAILGGPLFGAAAPTASGAPGPGSVAAQEPERLLVGATVIDGTGAEPVRDGWVHLRGDRIVAVGGGEPPAVAGAETLDLTGKSVIPGLADMHAHLRELPNARWVLKLLLAHGVTRVRDTGNSLGHIAAIRRWVASEEDVPRYYAANSPLQGSSEELRFLRSGEEISEVMDEYAAFPVDFVKVYNFLSTGGMAQVGEIARERGLSVIGHTPLSGTSVAAIDAGLLTMEHLRLRPWEVIDDLALVARYPIDVPLMERTAFWAHLDPDARSLGQTLDLWEERRERFFVTPTLVTQEAVARSYDYPEPRSAFEDRPGMDLVSPRALEEWKQSSPPSDRWGELTPEQLDEARRSVDGMTRFVGLAHERGVRFLSGTDIGVFWLVPGRSLHRELRRFVEGAGMTPVEALQTSTGHAALVFSTPDRGTLEAGHVADLVVVDGDVSTDIGALERIEAVFLEGRRLSPDRLLEEARRWAARDTPVDDGKQDGSGDGSDGWE